jgi:hypothetical protein
MCCRKELSPWQLFHRQINQFELYNPELPYLDLLLEDMSEEPIVNMVQRSGGTQLKLILSLLDQSRVMFKPMRYCSAGDWISKVTPLRLFFLFRFPREQGTLPDHFYFVDFERHTAEIAAFHLDR